MEAMTETRNGFEEWLKQKRCPDCGEQGKLKTSVVRLGKLNDYRCAACGAEGITILEMRGPVSHP